MSSAIYYKVLKYFRGYGIRFSIITSLICGLIMSVSLSVKIDSLTSQLLSLNEDGETSIDYIANQFPDIQYNGRDIVVDNNTSPILIKAPNNARVIAINSANTLKVSEQNQIPFILNKKKVIINLGIYKMELDYSQILGSKNRIITGENIKDLSNTIIKTFNTRYNILALPILSIMKFISNLIDNIFILIITIIVVKLSDIALNLQSIFRTIIFASAPSMILSSLILYTVPTFIFLAAALKLYCLILMYKALLQIRNEGKGRMC